MIDLIATLLFIGAMIAGYLSGGFREMFKVTVMLALTIVFFLPSVRDIFLQFGPAANGVFIVSFLVAYFVVSWSTLWLLKGIIETREGMIGGLNKALGVFAGLLKAMILTLLATYVVQFLWSKRMLSEAKPYLEDSFIFTASRTVLDFFM